MRLNEICQLTTADIITKDEVVCFSINDKNGKRVKTANAIRIIPIHPTLIKCGFLQYVEQQKMTLPTKPSAYSPNLYRIAVVNCQPAYQSFLIDCWINLMKRLIIMTINFYLNTLHTHLDTLSAVNFVTIRFRMKELLFWVVGIKVQVWHHIMGVYPPKNYIKPFPKI